MPRAGLRAAIVGVLLALLHALLPASAAAARPAAEGTSGFCPGDSGVTVVVDFAELGGGRIVRCAPGGAADGLDALRGAGFEVAGTGRWGDAFICRINGRPGPDAEPCVDTPPASAYWSYWHASNGGEWTYSQRGATYRTPPEGSFEGWSFALNRENGETPPPGVEPLRPAPDDDGGSPSGPSGGAGSPGGDGGAGGAGGAGSPGGDGGDGGAGGAGGDSDSGSGGGAAAGGIGGQGGQGGDPGDMEPPPGASGEPGAEDSAEPGETPGAETEEATPSPGGTQAPGPAPTEAAEWSGEDEEFAQEQAEGTETSGPSASTVAALGLLAALAAAGGFAAWRRRQAAGGPDGER